MLAREAVTRSLPQSASSLERDAADPDQHALVRPRRRVRARARRTVFGGRRAGGRERQHGRAKALVLVIGNVVVLVLEGLVVSIQTTRLVLFEFFTRFFRAEGREFRPLPAPPVYSTRRDRR